MDEIIDEGFSSLSEVLESVKADTAVPTVINFEKGFDAYVKAHQKTWKHDRSQSVGASEVFGCMRKAWFGKHGTEKDTDHKDKWGALQRGDLIENHFVEPAVRWFMENLHGSARLVWGGKKQRTLIDGRLSATPDGLVIGVADDALAEYGIASLGGSGCFTFEVKSIDPRVNLKEEKAVHRGQVQVQMGLIRQKTMYKPNYAVILYVDASFFDDIDVFIVSYDQKAFEVAKKRAADVFSIKNVAEIFPEGKIEGGCEYCPFTVACSRATKNATPDDKAGESNKKNTALPLLDEFEQLARTERAASNAKKVAEAEAKEASERLKQWFRETGVRRAITADDGIKASISWIKGRKTYDIEAMRADGIDVDAYQREGEGYDRLNVSEKGARRSDEDE